MNFIFNLLNLWLNYLSMKGNNFLKKNVRVIILKDSVNTNCCVRLPIVNTLCVTENDYTVKFFFILILNINTLIGLKENHILHSKIRLE